MNGRAFVRCFELVPLKSIRAWQVLEQSLWMESWVRPNEWCDDRRCGFKMEGKYRVDGYLGHTIVRYVFFLYQVEVLREYVDGHLVVQDMQE
jgi:hypothetical protein